VTDSVVSLGGSPSVSGVVRNADAARSMPSKPPGRPASAARNPVVSQPRLRKGVNPLPFRPRPVADEQRLALARLLTDRDRRLARAVARHRVMTSDQLAEVFFDSRRRAQDRLLRLHGLQVLDRFEPIRPAFGRVPLHYVIGRLGAAVLAAEDGTDPERAIRRWKADRALVLGGSQRLFHLLGINAFYAALAGQARRDPAAALRDWMTEGECAAWAVDLVRPDAYGVWSENRRCVEFFLEYDRGTEPLGRLAAKLAGYERLEAERGESTWVLFALAPRREPSARKALAGATVPVATARLDHLARPQDELWLPLGEADRRLRLAELAEVPKPPEALARAAAGSVRAWRFDRSRPDNEEVPIDPD
jgi:hypothetical protein